MGGDVEAPVPSTAVPRVGQTSLAHPLM